MTLPELPLPPSSVHWFMEGGCVSVGSDGVRQVLVGGMLVGSFRDEDRCLRNALLLGLSKGKKVNLGRLAKAFEITAETLRLLRKIEVEDGVVAALTRASAGRPPKLSAAQQRRVEELFAEGLGPGGVHAKFRGRVSLRTVGRLRSAWMAQRTAQAAIEAAQQSTGTPHQMRFVDMQLERASTEAVPVAAPSTNVPAATHPAVAAPSTNAPAVTHPTVAAPSTNAPAVIQPTVAAPSTNAPAVAPAPVSEADFVMREQDDDQRGNERTAVQSAGVVQHLGSWLLVAVVARLGLFAHAHAACKQRVSGPALEIALEALIAALGIGQRCVEGVRRLATRSAAVLLRARWVPSASWTRRTLGKLASDLGGFLLHMAMATEYLRQAQGTAAKAGRPTLLYVDNHLRPYTGKRVLRRGWRMQDKRAVPGTSDYYVHDAEGRPVFRFSAPEHGSLPDHLPGIARTIRDTLGITGRLLFAFDRGGSYAEHLSTLRDEGFSFVTYERAPLAKISRSAFTKELWFGSEDDPESDREHIRYTASRANLGKGRGRVRRIATLVSDDRERSGERQVNLLAFGDEDPVLFIEAMRGRWSQENGLKHSVERWGTNHLDGRATRPYPPEEVIPNPARRRLDHELRTARDHEAKARRELAALRPSAPAPKRARLEQDIEQSLARQRELEALRPSVPTHAEVRDTELAGLLEQHRDEYKTTIDAVRIACANAESELAIRLGTSMKRPAEAKRLLANVLSAPGSVRVREDRIDVELAPAATDAESQAIAALFAEVNQWRLSLPGDASARPLRFALQK